MQVQEIVDPVFPEQLVNEADNDDNIHDAPIQDHYDDNDPDASRIPIDRRPQPVSFVSKRVKMVARKKRKKKAWFKTIPKSPTLPIYESKYVSRTEATGGLLSWFYDEKIKL
ncbi:hypothetical protein L1987_32640 [Smallanthus sonchifolius]|uniref:Uncharacterized protein n=1 Tax=Smallanthus sonchifolius TaxID=185202 RepID=A0ACB9HNK5_9ASTR|nr:hypothetical protein L1987_32640 [Smallanthus sonchifolius]